MHTNTGMRRLGPMRRSLLTAGALLAVVTPLGCANPFDTDTKNPNAVAEAALDDPAGATTLTNGLGAAVTRALTAIYGPYSMATDELTWVGSREFWKTLDDGDISDPVNEYTDGAFPFVGEARWTANYTLPKLLAWDAAGLLRNRRDLVRAHIFASVIYITIADMFNDFVLNSDRTVATAAVGPANMRIFYDSAVVFLDRALPVAVALADIELQRQVLALRARARFSRAAWATLRPSLAAPTNPLISDAGATADAAAMLAVGGVAPTPESWRFRLTPTATNLADINLGFEMNNRGEIRAGDRFVVANPARPIVPLDGLPGIRMLDPVTGEASTTVANAISACCRPGAAGPGNNVPFTIVSAREMRLIQAEERLFAGDNPTFLARLNTSRAVDGLPAYGAVVGNGRGQLEYERMVQLYLQGRRLTDMYRFGTRDLRWLPTQTTSLRACFLPIPYGERLQNVLAPQPNNLRLCL